MFLGERRATAYIATPLRELSLRAPEQASDRQLALGRGEMLGQYSDDQAPADGGGLIVGYRLKNGFTPACLARRCEALCSAGLF